MYLAIQLLIRKSPHHHSFFFFLLLKTTHKTILTGHKACSNINFENPYKLFITYSKEQSSYTFHFHILYVHVLAPCILLI